MINFDVLDNVIFCVVLFDILATCFWNCEYLIIFRTDINVSYASCLSLKYWCLKFVWLASWYDSLYLIH